MADRLVLGTAQLGMTYGINNKLGRPDFKTACDIVKTAFEHGISRFDTAQAYGDSETVLGEALKTLGLCREAKIYSKLDPRLDLSDKHTILEAVDNSLRKLGIEHLEGLLLHDEDKLQLWDKGLESILASLVARGKVKSAGSSFYSPNKALEALHLDGIDFIQIPANIFDHRFEKAGVFQKGKTLQKHIFIRSIFLQGLLLMPIDSIPHEMSYAHEYVQKLCDLSAKLGVNRQELTISYVRHKYQDCYFVFGAESRAQVSEISELFQSSKALAIPDSWIDSIPENLVNPCLWPKK